MKSQTFNLDQVKDLFRDPSFVPFLMIWITHGIGGWGISFVLPTVIYELGISGTGTAISQILTMPPFTMVFVILLTLAFFIHRGQLSPWVAALGVEAVQIVCYILLITVRHPVAKYIFVTIATAASQSFFPIIWPGMLRVQRFCAALQMRLTLALERIRAARGTTSAGLAIGITNVSIRKIGHSSTRADKLSSGILSVDGNCRPADIPAKVWPDIPRQLRHLYRSTFMYDCFGGDELVLCRQGRSLEGSERRRGCCC